MRPLMDWHLAPLSPRVGNISTFVQAWRSRESCSRNGPAAEMFVVGSWAQKLGFHRLTMLQ
jgi:hypothetical protein